MISIKNYFDKLWRLQSRPGDAGHKALILAWSHPRNTVLSLTASLAGGLAANNIDVTIINLSDKRQRRKMATYHKQFFNQIFIMGALPLRYKCNGISIQDYFEGNIYFWVLDPVIYDLDRVTEVRGYFEKAQNSEKLYCLFPDRSNIKFMADWIGNKAIYFPFAGSFNHQANPQANSVSTNQNKSGIVVLANIGQELNDRASQALPNIIDELDPFGLSAGQIKNLADHVMNDEENSNIAVSVKNFMNMPFQDMYNPRTINLLAAMDASEKRRRRIKVVESIRSLKIDIIGEGWEQIFGERPNITYSKKPVQHERPYDLFSDYKVLLDFSPNWDHGFNDRVITSLGAGCRVVTSKNLATTELCDAANLISTYPMVHPEPTEGLEIALAASCIDENLIETIQHDHNWSKRVQQLVT
ncbi:MAG: hypothetical protein POG74_10870 [Acidocella sp.]|nr:hypothetical protein [Acidocella sp.]